LRAKGKGRSGTRTPYDYGLPKPKSGVPPGGKREGWVIFGRPEPSDLFEISFAWERGGYISDPLVFQIAP
jgi:hypothetical protein